MLWYKAWLETRWRFLLGLLLLSASAVSTVLVYPTVIELLPLAPRLEGEMGRRVGAALELARDYRSYVWSEWFLKNLPQTWGLFAALLGTGGLLTQASGHALFTLSLPVSRTRVTGIRAATGLAELLVLALIPSLVVPAVSPAIGQSYGAGDAMLHGLFVFAGGAVFFGLAFLLSTMFADIWRPFLIALCAVAALSFLETAFRNAPFSLWRVISGETYFRDGAVPWAGLLASFATTAALLYAACRNIERHDF